MSLPARILAMTLFLLFHLAATCLAASDSVHEYRLGIGDRVKISVLGEAELSEELLIDGAGNIEMPLLGSVQLLGKTLAEARSHVTKLLENGFLKDPIVLVRIGELRPIFVIGDVRTPGQYSFKFGLTALNAIAMAGGFGSNLLPQGDAIANLIGAKERLLVLSRRYVRLRVRLSRIEAEQADQEQFDPPSLPKTMSHLDITELAERELERLNSSRDAHERFLKLLRDQRPTVAREIKARKEEIAAQNDLIQIYETQLGRVSSIKLASRMLELRTQLAQGRGLLSRLRGEIAALEEKLVALDIRAEEAITKRQKRIISELAETRQQLSEVEASLPSAMETVELRRRQAGQLFAYDDWQKSYEISLKSSRTGELRKVSTADHGSVEPGDTIIVRMIKPPGAVQPSTTIDNSSSSGSSRHDPPQPAWKSSRPGA